MELVKKFLAMRLEEKMVLFSVFAFAALMLFLFFEGNILEGVIQRWSMPGLFVASFFSATIFFTFPLEGLFPFLLQHMDPLTVVAVAAVGSLLGTWVNYGLGLFGSRIIEKRYDHSQMEHAKKLMDKYGWLGLLVLVGVPIPAFPVDPLTIVPGVVRMNPIEFTVAVFAGKFIKYGIFAAAILGFINGFH